MLHIWIGRTGAGKTRAVYDELKKAVEQKKAGMILLVPPQSSHQAERDMAEYCGDQAPLYAEALTFKTLAARIFGQGGHLADQYLDDHGRLLIMKNARDDVADLMEVYQGSSARPELISGFLAAINELKLYNIQPGRLLDTAKTMEEEAGKRLRDLSYIYASYDNLISGELHDPADLYDRMSQVAEETGFFRGKTIYLDAFNGFIPKEYGVIEEMIREAENVTLVLTADRLKETVQIDDLFSKSQEIVSHFRAFANKLHIAWDIRTFEEQKRLIPESLRFLEKELIEGNQTAYLGEKDDGIMCIAVAGRRKECEQAAAKALDWVSRGYRYRDIAVVVRNIEEYSSELETVFRGCEIPFYMDTSVTVDKKPLFVMLLAALDAVTESFSEESMTALLKSGMTGLDQDGLDRMEYYIRRWNIRGSKWLNPEAWKAHPDGFLRTFDEKTNALLEQLEAMREKIMAPLANLKRNLHGSAKEMCTALFTYASETGLYEDLTARADVYREKGETRIADEYNQLWDIFCDTLDQFVLIAGERSYRPEEFSGMFRLILSEIKVGVIPSGLDNVTVGEAGRFRAGNTKCLIVLGNNQGEFPKKIQSSSLIDDTTRLYLRSQEIKLDLTQEEQQFQEQFLVYQTYFSPSEKLLLTYIKKDDLQPSEYVDRIIRLMPWTVGSPIVGKSLYLLKNDQDARTSLALRGLFEQKKIRLYENGGKISAYPTEMLKPSLVTELYGDPLRMSPSKIEKFHTCKFAFFMQYGLGVRDFRQASFSYAEAGEFIHFVFEKLGRYALSRGGFPGMTEEEVLQKTDEYAGEFYESVFDAPEYRTKRTDYLFWRLARDARELSSHMYRELSVGEFKPFLFEKEFGGENNPPILYRFDEGNVAVSGRLDRADHAIVKGKNFVRLIDYKTGSKDFTFTDLYNGLNTQLPLYLFNLAQKGTQPAAFFYMPSRVELAGLPRHASPEEIKKEKDKAGRYKGLMLGDIDVMEAMEPGLKNGTAFLPTGIKDGKPERADAVASEKEFELIRKHMESIMKSMNRELRNGHIEADPYAVGSRVGCDNCMYQKICRIYPENLSAYERVLDSMKCRSFMDKLKEKEAEDNELK